MKIEELAFFIVFGTMMALLVTTGLRDRLRKRRLVASLAARVQRDDEHFGREYCPDPKRADVAVRTRRVLSENLKVPLKGLAPSDRLKEDLNAELPRNSLLFWELEEEFGIECDMEDSESFEKTLQGLVTFQDLVEFVERKISESPAETPGQSEKEKPSRAYEIAVRCSPVLCVSGFLIAVVGVFLDKRTMLNLGMEITWLGIAVWGLATGGKLLLIVIRGIRETSLKEAAAHPRMFVWPTIMVLLSLWLGIGMFWGILKNVFK